MYKNKQHASKRKQTAAVKKKHAAKRKQTAAGKKKLAVKRKKRDAGKKKHATKRSYRKRCWRSDGYTITATRQAWSSAARHAQ